MKDNLFDLIKSLVWFIMNVLLGLLLYYVSRHTLKLNIYISIFIGIISYLLIYIHPIPFTYVTWKYALPKKTMTKYIINFGLPYDVCKDSAIWKNIGGFYKTIILDEQIKHTHPIDHIDFVYSTIKIPGIKPNHVCIIANSTGSIFVDLLKQEVTARCHYLVKNAVSLGFVQDIVAGKISKEKARDEYARRILNNIYPNWFKDPLNESHKTLGEGRHHLIITGREHKH